MSILRELWRRFWNPCGQALPTQWMTAAETQGWLFYRGRHFADCPYCRHDDCRHAPERETPLPIDPEREKWYRIEMRAMGASECLIHAGLQ